MAARGEASDYYDGGQSGGAPQNYGSQQPTMAYEQQQDAYKQNQNAQNGQQYAPPTQPPPNYNADYVNQGGNGGEKPTFDQAFKIDKPKWNDLWAGVLFIAVFCGYGMFRHAWMMMECEC